MCKQEKTLFLMRNGEGIVEEKTISNLFGSPIDASRMWRETHACRT